MVNREKVTVTPHLGASTMEAQEGVVIEIVEAVDGALQGKLVATAFLSSLECKKKDGSDGDGEVNHEGLKLRAPLVAAILNMMVGALRSPRRELRNELKYVQNGVEMNEISCLKVRHVEHKSGTILHRLKCEVGLDL
ncbi:hypothetical protein Tco_0686828 [Tanacetum coccineum]